MGTTLEVTTGLGFAVPPATVDAYEEAHEGESFYEYLDDLIGWSGPLRFELAYYYDYSPADDGKPAHAVFLKSTVTTEYGVGVFPVGRSNSGRTYLSAPAEERIAMEELAETLGIYLENIEWFTVVSIG